MKYGRKAINILGFHHGMIRQLLPPVCFIAKHLIKKQKEFKSWFEKQEVRKALLCHWCDVSQAQVTSFGHIPALLRELR